MKAFVINLKKNNDRREYMHNMLTEYGLEHEFVDGLYGREADDKFISQIYDSKKSIEVNGQDLSRAEIGCAYSHTLVYKKIVEQNLVYALVLEDDVYLDPAILDVITLLESTKYKSINNVNKSPISFSRLEFDWLQIDYNKPGLFFLLHWTRLAKKDYKFIFKFVYMSLLSIYEGIRNSFYVFVNHISKKLRGKSCIGVVKFCRPLYLASAYIITGDVAKKLLMTNTPVFLAADRLQNYLSWEQRIYTNNNKNNIVVKAVAPLISIQRRETFGSELDSFRIDTFNSK